MKGKLEKHISWKRFFLAVVRKYVNGTVDDLLITVMRKQKGVGVVQGGNRSLEQEVCIGGLLFSSGAHMHFSLSKRIWKNVRMDHEQSNFTYFFKRKYIYEDNQCERKRVVCKKVYCSS